jgi:argininosuccinate synthase
MAKNKIVVAYSGGLDTSIMVHWLKNHYDADIITFTGNLGQTKEIKNLEEKALKSGASKVYIEDLRKEFLEEYVWPALKAGAIYEDAYPMATSIGRPLLAKALVDIARKENATMVAHGCTGKGNDQVRFEFGYYALMPEVKIISPWKDPEWLGQFEGRSDMIAYARQFDIPVKASTKKPYSEDENLLHISHEAGILEDAAMRCPSEVFSHTLSPQDAPDRETVVAIEFIDGIPVKVTNETDGIEKSDPLDMFLYLNTLGHDNAIGRVDMVENRYIGIKSRGVYETPGGSILWFAHRDLEGICMDKEVMHLRDMLMPKYAELIYNGYWFSPEFDFLSAAFDKSQELITGTAKVVLYKGNMIGAGVSSPYSLYNEALGSMEVSGGYQPVDCKGFININAIRLQAHHYWLKARAMDEKKE